MATQALRTPRLTRLAQRDRRPFSEAARGERCELCAAPVDDEHRHLVDLETRRLLCVCRSCALLFARSAAGGGHLRLVGDRRLALDGFALDDAVWARLRIPVEMAFFFESSPAGRVLAFYPGPMGATESLLELDTWREVERANPVLAGMEPDVEALLVNRARGARSHWLVPVDDCYRLVALIRTSWRGFTGGAEVWSQIDGFFDGLRRLARPYPVTMTSERS